MALETLALAWDRNSIKIWQYFTVIFNTRY